MTTPTKQRQYTDPVLQLYADLIVDNNKVIKEVFFGEKTPAQSQLPAVILSFNDMAVNAFSNAEDQHLMSINCRVVTNVLSDIVTDNNKIQAGLSQLYDIIAGRNADLTLKDTSILDILRSNDRLGPSNNIITDLDTATTIDYGSTVQQQDGSWSLEGEITFVAHYHQIRN